MAAPAVRSALPVRLWHRYTTALRETPIRTRMISSGVLYVVGDLTAQLGIEDKRLFGSVGLADDVSEEKYDVSSGLFCGGRRGLADLEGDADCTHDNMYI
jgi:hypothetical protein